MLTDTRRTSSLRASAATAVATSPGTDGRPSGATREACWPGKTALGNETGVSQRLNCLSSKAFGARVEPDADIGSGFTTTPPRRDVPATKDPTAPGTREKWRRSKGVLTSDRSRGS